MAVMDAATRSAVQATLLPRLFAGLPPNPAEVLTSVEGEVVRRGYTLAESGLQPWGRKLELELGALTGGLNRSLGQYMGRAPGVDSGCMALAQRAVSGAMTLRGQGVGPESWLLWLDQDFTSTLAESVVSKALAGSPLASIVGDIKSLLQAVDQAAAIDVAGYGWPLPLPADDAGTDRLPRRTGTGSFGPVAFEVSTEKVKTWSGLTREHKGRYATHEVLGATPRLEFLAPDISQTTFSVRLDMGLGASPAEDMTVLADLCRTGRVERLVLGGRNLGAHVLESVRETWKHTGPGGVVLVAEMELTLKEYA